MVRLSIVRRTVSAIVSSSWLHNAVPVNSSSVRILEASWPNTREQYESGHIPRAQYYDLSRHVTSHQYVPRGVPLGGSEVEQWTDYMQELGVNNDHHVVMYDRGSMLMAARAWWTFRLFGHYKVSVLNGGWKNWERENLPTETGPMETPERGKFTIRTVNKSLLRSYEDMSQAKQEKGQIVDARAVDDFTGQAKEPSKPTKAALTGASLPLPSSMQRGHIPGSLHLVEDNLLDENKCLLPEDQLKQVFRESGVDLGAPMTAMCYNGFAATLLALAAATLGKKDVAVYLGSWTEYGQRAQDNQVTTGRTRGYSISHR